VCCYKAVGFAQRPSNTRLWAKSSWAGNSVQSSGRTIGATTLSAQNTQLPPAELTALKDMGFGKGHLLNTTFCLKDTTTLYSLSLPTIGAGVLCHYCFLWIRNCGQQHRPIRQIARSWYCCNVYNSCPHQR